jgi:hypothetical protein
MKTKRDPVKDMVSAQLGVTIMITLQTIIMCILVGMMFANYVQGKDLPCFPGEGHEEYVRIEKFKKTTALCLKVVSLPLCAMAYLGASKIRVFFENVQAMGCSDDITNKATTTLAEGIGKTADNNQSALAVTAFTFFLELVFVIMGALKRPKKPEEDKEEDDGEGGKVQKKEEYPGVVYDGEKPLKIMVRVPAGNPQRIRVPHPKTKRICSVPVPQGAEANTMLEVTL